MAPSNRRDNERTPILFKVQYQQPNDLLSDYLTDLAEGGLFIRTSALFLVGQTIAFTVSFPSLLDPLPLTGVVRWRREPSDSHPDAVAGVGIEFVFPDEAVKKYVADLVAQVRRPPNIRAKNQGPFLVLLVEDNPFVHDLFRHAVKRFHKDMPEVGTLEIHSAADGQDGLQYVEQNNVDLAIIDHFLPVMNGSELVVRMRTLAKYKTIPILVVSVGGEGVREEAMQAGADLYLDKPVLLKQLLATLRLLMTNQRLPMAAPAAEVTAGT